MEITLSFNRSYGDNRKSGPHRRHRDISDMVQGSRGPQLKTYTTRHTTRWAWLDTRLHAVSEATILVVQYITNNTR
jgi:hypothetical protein